MERELQAREQERAREQQKEREREIEEALNERGEVEKDRAGPEKSERTPDAAEREPQLRHRDDNARSHQERDDNERGQQRGHPARDKEKEPRGRIIAGNMAGRNEQELEAEFEAVASRRPDVERKVLHAIIGIPAEDKVSGETKVRISERFADGMGLGNTTWVAIEHDEHDHTEIHHVSSLIDLDGKTIPDSKDYERAEEIMRRIEKEFGLREVEPSREAMRRSPTQKEMKHFERTGVLSTWLRLQAHVDEAIGRGATATELIERLEERGIDVIPYRNEEGDVRGVSYRLDGKVMRGRDLGRGYTWPGLQKEWPKDKEHRQGRVEYDHARDYEALSHAGSREDERRGLGAGARSTKVLGREIGGDRAEQLETAASRTRGGNQAPRTDRDEFSDYHGRESSGRQLGADSKANRRVGKEDRGPNHDAGNREREDGQEAGRPGVSQRPDAKAGEQAARADNAVRVSRTHP